jgi:hypothetical protein
LLLAAPVLGSPAAGFGVAPGAAVLGRAREAAAPGAAALSAAPSIAVPVRVPAVFGGAPDSAVFARAPVAVLFARVLFARVLAAFVDLVRAVGGSGAAALGAVEPPPMSGASGASGSAASAPAWPCPAAFAARVRLPARGWLPVPVGACSAVRLGAGPVPPPAAPAPGIPFSEVTAP